MEHPARTIAAKRDGERLTEGQIRDFVTGIAGGQVGDAQIGAFTMAVCLQGMDAEETAALTLAMRDSGVVVAHDGDRPKVDKHSTGGVGDKVSLILAPLVAACGVAVPMISGRGLGHTGGTLDKLGAIPGYRTGLSIDEFRSVVDRVGFAMAGASADIAPADAKIYAVRDVSGTVESLPLITASILSKKLAEGIEGLVMDVKVGDGAFLGGRDAAAELADSLVQTGRSAGLPVVALLTGMDAPLGRTIGNALEVRESIDVLRGDPSAGALLDVTRALATEMLRMAFGGDEAAARNRIDQTLASGAALEAFRQNLDAQGGDPRVVDDPTALPTAPKLVPLLAEASGPLWFRSRALGEAVVDLGGGRRQPSDSIDPAVGIVLEAEPGMEVVPGDLIATVHARTDGDAQRAVDAIRGATVVGAAPSVGVLEKRL